RIVDLGAGDLVEPRRRRHGRARGGAAGARSLGPGDRHRGRLAGRAAARGREDEPEREEPGTDEPRVTVEDHAHDAGTPGSRLPRNGTDLLDDGGSDVLDTHIAPSGAMRRVSSKT